MAIINNRLAIPEAIVINGVNAAGAMQARIQAGYDEVLRTPPDGLEVPLKDKAAQFVRGTIISQDWVEAVGLLTGTVGTCVFFEGKSGTAHDRTDGTGFVKHTLTNPVIHRVRFSFTKGRYGTVTFDFECRPADETKGIADMWGMTDSPAGAISYSTAARGGYRVESAVFDIDPDDINIYHVTGFEFGITMPLVKACNDGDVGYTCVDARLDGLRADGSLTFQDGAITTAKLLAQQLLIHAKDQLILTCRQSQGATSKTVTLLGVDFETISNNSDVNADFTEYTVNFEIANDTTTQLTLAGTNKVIVIDDAA